MDLHGIVSGAISAVNPQQRVIVRRSIGYATASDGGRTSTYAPDVLAWAQVQDLSQKDMRQLDALNIQGSQKVAYLEGELAGLIRGKKEGGDILVLPDGSNWYVTAVLEQWPDWVKCSITLQNGA